MHIAHWRPDITLQTFFLHPNYVTATSYFLDTLLLVTLALLSGAGLLLLLARMSLARKMADTPVALRISEFVFLSISTGLGIIIAELFVIALFGQLTPTVVSGVLGCSALANLVIIAKTGKHPALTLQAPTGWFPVLVLLVFAGCLFVLQYTSVYSANISDSTSYHVPYADFFLQHHGLAVNEHLIYPFHSLNINMLYSLALMLNHELGYVQSIHALFATLTLFGIYVAAIHTGQKPWLALLLTILFLQVFTVQFSRLSANVDLGSMYFITAAFFALLFWQKNPAARWLLACSAINLGIAMGSKYLMGFFALPAALMIILQLRKDALRPLLFYAACTFAWGSWWYIRNAILAGNPVHPFATGIFGYYLWNEQDMIGQMENLHNHNIPNNLLGFLAAPYYAFVNPVLFQHNTAHVLAGFYLALPLVMSAEKRCRTLLIPCLTYLLFWVHTSADSRYMLPLVPMMFVYIGSCVNGVLVGMTPAWLYQRRWLKVSTIALGGSLTLSALAFTLLDTQQRFINVLYHDANPDYSHKTLLQNDQAYALFDKANAVFGPDSTVFEFFFREYRWFFKGNLMGTVFGEHGYMRVLDQTAYGDKAGYSPEKLQAILQTRYQADGFIISASMLSPVVQQDFDRYFERVYRNNAGAIYRFRKTESVQTAPGKPDAF